MRLRHYKEPYDVFTLPFLTVRYFRYTVTVQIEIISAAIVDAELWFYLTTYSLHQLPSRIACISPILANYLDTEPDGFNKVISGAAGQ